MIARYVTLRWAHLGSAVLSKPSYSMVRRLKEREPPLEMGRTAKAPTRAWCRSAIPRPGGGKHKQQGSERRRIDECSQPPILSHFHDLMEGFDAQHRHETP